MADNVHRLPAGAIDRVRQNCSRPQCSLQIVLGHSLPTVLHHRPDYHEGINHGPVDREHIPLR